MGEKLRQEFEKFIAYRAPEIIDPNLIKEVYDIWNQHDKEINEFWHQTNPEARQNLVAAFRKELEQQWSREFSEICSEKVMNTLSENLITGIEMAYASGYMMAKGWISMEHLNNYNLCIGDKLARDIRSTLKGAKSRGFAFANAFTAVAAQGHLAILGQ